MAVVEERHDRLLAMDPEDEGSAEHGKSDAQQARENRNDEPIGEIGGEVWAAPPRLCGVAGKARGEDRKDQSRCDHVGRELEQGFAELGEDRSNQIPDHGGDPVPKRARHRYQGLIKKSAIAVTTSALRASRLSTHE